MEPETYQERANTNKPNIRTTFYNEKQGVTSFAQEDGDAKKAEEAADEAKKAPKVAEALEQKAQAAAAVGDTSEKTSILEPMAYERRANYALPFSRTTFYSQQGQQQLAQPYYNERHGVWMSLAQEDGDAKKAEEAKADAAKEKDQAASAAEQAKAAAAVGATSEKVSIIEPDAYERRSNYALPFMRTTFYGQK